MVAGVINVTPDSFYAPSRVGVKSEILLEKASKMVSEGARILAASAAGPDPADAREDGLPRRARDVRRRVAADERQQ